MFLDNIKTACNHHDDVGESDLAPGKRITGV